MEPGQEQAGAVAARPQREGEERVPAFLGTLLERFPILRREPHLVTVHFPVVFAILIPYFNCMFILRPKVKAFEKTAFYMLVLGAIATPAATATGLFSWWLSFAARPSRPIKTKMAASAALTVDMITMLAWRLVDEEVMTSPGRSRSAYVALSALMPALALVLGRVGGRLSGHR